jgi:hypothetical protein
MRYLILVFLLFAGCGEVPKPEVSGERNLEKEKKRILTKPTSDEIPEEFQTEKRLALVIGNDEYENFTNLDNAQNDARDIGKTLEKLDFEVFRVFNGNQKEMGNKIVSFGNLLKQNGGVGLIFYAGHGLETAGQNYLVPVDANITSEIQISMNAISLESVLKVLEGAENRLNIVILDACRNDPTSSFRSLQNGGLVAPPTASGTYIAYSADVGQVAEDGSWKNGTFTKHLLATLKFEGVKLNDVFKNVRLEVEEETDGKKSPASYDKTTGDFYFRLPSSTQTVTSSETVISSETKISPDGRNDNTPEVISIGENKIGTSSVVFEERSKFSLGISTSPADAIVKVNGKSFKSGSLLERGKYQISISKRGYETYKYNLELQKDEVLDFTLQKTHFKLKIDVTNVYPEGVVFDFENVNFTNGMKLKRGKYKFKVSKRGFHSKEGKIDLQNDMTLKMTLEKISVPKPKVVETPKPKVVTLSRKGEWDKRIYRGERSYSKFSTNLVKDNFTNLVWQKSGSSNFMNWESAKKYCENLSLDGYSDFRLPTVKELYYLADRSKYDPAVDSNYFNLKSNYYWSITKYHNGSSSSWAVRFKDGDGNWGYKTHLHFAACILDL